MKISTLLSGTALSIAAVGASFAADLPLRNAPLAPAPIFLAAPTWAGFYVGVNLGVVHTKTQAGLGWYDYAYTPSVGYDSEQSATTFGALAGLTAGYNFQNGMFVYGVEADIGGVFNGKSTGSIPYTVTGTAETRGLGTLRVRAGIASGATLFFLTAGAAAVDHKISVDSLTDTSKSGSSSKWKWAPVAGAGIEHQLGGGWTAKVEGLYVFETKTTLLGADRCTNSWCQPYGKAFRTKTDHAVLRFGVNYRFGAAVEGPVLARY